MKYPDLNLLIALDALLQEQNVSGAARRVGLSTPAMSHALARLRKQLGDPLLVRAGQKMVPTPRATQLRDHVHDLTDTALGLMAPQSPRDLASLDRIFRIKTSDHVLTVMGAALDRALRAAPNVALHVVPTEGGAESALLRDNQIDLAIGVYDYLPYADLPSEVRIQHLFEDRFVCVVRADHPTVGRTLSLAQFAELEHVQIAPRGNPGGYVDELLAEHDLRRRIVRAVPYFLTGLALVAETDYILTVSLRLARRLGERFGLRMVAPPRSLGLEPYSVSQLWHPRNDRDPEHRWFREVALDAAKAATRSRS